ncbi:hypothetical protein [Chryseolinea sp. H1M3-3]|uniref:hypothetical protein n=1 Tax=Chryseolinea sp. H1M3-3 TaxID=3034144 RepID=UPI0023ECD57D|nr:hypothetical protein [Chryseolinea sp. H1M3-3]
MFHSTSSITRGTGYEGTEIIEKAVTTHTLPLAPSTYAHSFELQYIIHFNGHI